MRIAFIGGVKFSHEILKKILENKHEISIIFSYEDSKSFSDMVDFEKISQKFGIRNVKVNNINDQKNIKILKEINPDLILVMGWSQLLKSEILKIPRLGVIGSHPTELPKYRGRAPIPWSIIKKIKESALTFFYIQEGVDNGDIVSQKKFIITKNDDASSLYEKICELGKEMILQLLSNLQNGNIQRKKQESKEIVENWPKRTPEDGKINWADSVEKIHTLIRASTYPYPGAFTFFKNKKLIIWKSSFEKRTTTGIGVIKEIEKNIIKISGSDGLIIILKGSLGYQEKLSEIFSDDDIGEKLG